MKKEHFLREPGSATLEEPEFISLLDACSTLWRRKWIIFSFSMLVSVLVALYLWTIAPTFRAATTVLVEGKTSQVVSIEKMYDIDSAGSEYLQTQLELLRSRALAERVVRQLDLTAYPEFSTNERTAPFTFLKNLPGVFEVRQFLGSFSGREPVTSDAIDIIRFDEVTKAFMSRISVERQGNSKLIKVQVDLSDPHMAAKAADALARGLIESQMEVLVEATTGATAWMNDRLLDLREQLQASEERLQRYRETENLVDVGGVSTISAAELAQTGNRMIDARRQRSEAESQYRQVQAIRGDWEKLAAIPAVLGHPLIQQFKAEEARARARVEERSRRYGARHPEMEAARSELIVASASLRGQVEHVVAGIERNYQLAVANQASLQASFNSNKSQIQNISRKEFKLRELQREVDANSALYKTFMNRLKETAATTGLDGVSVRIVDAAVVPTVPVKPKKVLIVVIVTALSLLLGALLTLLMEVFNNTFKSIEQVEDQLSVPVLGILPQVPTGQGGEPARLYGRGLNRSFSESVRTIRTSVALSNIKQPHKVILVTSSIPGEGKTTLSTNIACAFGQVERVLLIDADLRRPMLAKHFQLPVGAPGLANLIAGSAVLDDCIYQFDGLDIIAAGIIPPNPLELLASPVFSQLLEQLGARYQRIIIDSPPCLTVSDAELISTLAEFVIYVVKSEATPVPLVKKGIGKLLQSNAPVRGIVLTQVDVVAAGSNSGRYDGYFDYHDYSDSPV